MEYQLTEAQEYLNFDWKYRITLKYKSHIYRAKDKVNEDLIHLRNRVHSKLFGRGDWDLSWFPAIEKGKEGRHHIHLYVGAIHNPVKRNAYCTKTIIRREPIFDRGVKNTKTTTLKDYGIGAWFPPDLIRGEWEVMHQAVNSKNEEIRSYIEIIDRENSIGYGTKTFLDEKYNTRIEARNTTTDNRERQDIEKEVSKLRKQDLFPCIADWFYLREADKIK